MPKTLKGWAMFTVSVIAVLFVVNNVAFLQNLTTRKL